MNSSVEIPNRIEKKDNFEIQPKDISRLLLEHCSSLLASFYETQSEFLTKIYQRYGCLETANIILFFARNSHLDIMRQREKNLNYNISLENYWFNFNNAYKETVKISSVVKFTGIPKETIRRKIKKLTKIEYLSYNKNIREYSLNISNKNKSQYLNLIEKEIKLLSKFAYKFSKHLNLGLNLEIIDEEIKSQYSFYWYHFLTCELEWLKLWHAKLGDNDLLLIILQTIIPTLKYTEKNSRSNSEDQKKLDTLFKNIGKIDDNQNILKTSISAVAISQITGIPRATCIRKLDKLISLGFLIRDEKSKKFFINQNINDRTKNILTKDNVNSSIDIFSTYLAIILNNVMLNRK